MKYISLLFISLYMVSCGNTKDASAMNKQTPLTGNYNVTAIGDNTSFTEAVSINLNSEEHTVSGNSGCNIFNGSYTLDGSTLKFGALATTRKLCAPEANKLEQQVLNALNETARFSEENDSISFYNNEGTVLMTLGKSKTSNSKINQEQQTYQVEYTAITRGTFIMINYENNSLSFQKDRNAKKIVKALTQDEITSLNAKLAALDFNSLNTLEPPSKAHQYDGAAGATLKVTANGVTHQTPTFDHGNPPKTIEALVYELISLTEKL